MAKDKSQKAKTTAAGNKDIAAETGKDVPPIKRWIAEIEKERKDKDYKAWLEKCQKIVKIYKAADKEDEDTRRYNALWSMQQTLMPLTYASPPKPFIERRYSDKDPIARDASEILQRVLSYEVQCNGVHDALEDANEDFNLTSRGVTWVRYSPIFALRETDEKVYVDESNADEAKDKDIDKDERGDFFLKTFEEKIDEELDTEHVLFSDFFHGKASKWRHVPWVARRVPMTRSMLIKRFGKDKGSKPPLTIDCSDTKKDATDEEKGYFAKAEIIELWSKQDRKVYWICPDWADDFLDEKDDPLELDDFFPCPRPAYSTKTNDSLLPTPDYQMWQDIAIELDTITQRIKLLTEALRVVGVYDKSMGDVVKRVTSHTAENDMIPVEGWAMMQERGGLTNSIEWFPIEQVMNVLDKLQARRAGLVQELYETTGVSDIIRGASDPNETLGAQKLKGNYANKRLGKRQDKMARMAREKLEIMAQIICTQYSDETIKRISSAEEFMKDEKTGLFNAIRFNQALGLLRVGLLRRFRIRIDERSLAAQDLNEDRDERMMFLQGVAQLVTGFAAMAERFPGGKRLLSTLLMFGVRSFPLARTTEADFEEALKEFAGVDEAPGEQQSQQQPADKGKSPQELDIEAQKVMVQNRRVDAMFEEIKRKYEDDMRKHDIAVQKLQSDWAQFQKDAMIRETKVHTDAALREQQNQNTQQQMLNQHQHEQQRLQRDIQNDHVNAVQAFSAPRQQRIAA